MCPKFPAPHTDQQRDFRFTNQVSEDYFYEPYSAIGPDNASLDDKKKVSNAPESTSTYHASKNCADTKEVTVLQSKPHEIVDIKEEYIVENKQILFKDEPVTIKDPWPGSIKEVITKQVHVPREINNVKAHQEYAIQDKEFQRDILEQEPNKFPSLDSGRQVPKIHGAFDGSSAKSHSHRKEYKEFQKQFSSKLQVEKDINFNQNKDIKLATENEKKNVFSETFRDVTAFRCFSTQHPSLKQKKPEHSFYGSYACRSTQHPSLKEKGKSDKFDKNSRSADNQELMRQIYLLTIISSSDKEELPVVATCCYEIGQNGSFDFKFVEETKLEVFESHTVFDESEIVIHCTGNPIVDEKKINFVKHNNFYEQYEVQNEITGLNVGQRKLSVNKSLDSCSARNTSVSLTTQTMNLEFSFHETDNEYDRIQNTQSMSQHNKSQFITFIPALCLEEQRTHVLSLIAKEVKVRSFAFFLSTNLLSLLSLTFAFSHLNYNLWKSRPPPTKHPPDLQCY